MINTYNKSNVYYVCDMINNTYCLIGSFDELLNFLAKSFIKYKYKGEIDNISNYENVYFQEINMGNDYSHIVYNYEFYYQHICPKKYLFFDGFERTIDVRNFKEEAFKVYLQIKDSEKRFYFRKRSKKQGRKKHSGNHFKSRLPRKMSVKRLDSKLKTEYKEYHFKKLEDSNNPYPDWWDDTSRRVEGNWKSQYKTRKQYGIHKNVKDNSTIRKQLDDEFSPEEIDEMLFEDFYKN